VELLYAGLSQLLAPCGQLTAVQLFSAQQFSELAMLTGIGLRQDAQLVLGRELATRALLQLRIRGDLVVGQLGGRLRHDTGS